MNVAGWPFVGYVSRDQLTVRPFVDFEHATGRYVPGWPFRSFVDFDHVRRLLRDAVRWLLTFAMCRFQTSAVRWFLTTAARLDMLPPGRAPRR